MTETSTELLNYFRSDLKQNVNACINLTIRQEFIELLEKLGDPHKNLPPVFHVAGTNGKGSVCAYVRAILEAGGKKVHVYTSPHLVNFNERIRVAGELISERELVSLLHACKQYAAPGTITYFEAATAVALTAFARNKADYTVLEVGLGGRLDATNVVEPKLATIITRISGDHRDFLGKTIREIAYEKAGIMRTGVPCFAALQPDDGADDALRATAKKLHAPLLSAGRSWKIERTDAGFHYADASGELDLPLPALLGPHQIENAALAIAAVREMVPDITRDQIAQGLQNVEWPARLQRLQRKSNSLAALVPEGSELWLDGGHNDSAGEALAKQAAEWQRCDTLKLYMICGMLTTKHPEEFLTPLKPYVAALQTVRIDNENASHSAEQLADIVRKKVGIENVAAASTLDEAIRNLRSMNAEPKRILICGSLYLAGQVLSR